MNSERPRMVRMEECDADALQIAARVLRKIRSGQPLAAADYFTSGTHGAGGFEPDAVLINLDRMREDFYQAEPDAPVARIVLGLEGGIVQGASTTAPVEIVVRDYDTDSGEEERLILDGEHGDCFAYEIGTAIDPELIEATARQMREVDARMEK